MQYCPIYLEYRCMQTVLSYLYGGFWCCFYYTRITVGNQYYFVFFLACFFYLLQYRIPDLFFVLRGRRIEGLASAKPLYAPSAQDKE